MLSELADNAVIWRTRAGERCDDPTEESARVLAAVAGTAPDGPAARACAAFMTSNGRCTSADEVAGIAISAAFLLSLPSLSQHLPTSPFPFSR